MIVNIKEKVKIKEIKAERKDTKETKDKVRMLGHSERSGSNMEDNPRY